MLRRSVQTFTENTYSKTDNKAEFTKLSKNIHIEIWECVNRVDVGKHKSGIDSW